MLFMQASEDFTENTFELFDRKDYIAEAILEWVRCRIIWDSEGKVSMVTYEDFDITDRFIGMMYDDSERLHDTMIEGYLTLKKGKEYITSEKVKEVTTYNKETIEIILKEAVLKPVFVAKEVLKFLGENLYLEAPYSARKLKVEDVLIGIDNTFEMKYKDNYTMLHPMKTDRETFKKVCAQGFRGMSFKRVDSKYTDSISQAYVEVYPNN